MSWPKNSASFSPSPLFVGGIAILAVVAIFAIWFGTSTWGIGITPDSVAYISGANSLLADGTLRVIEVEGKAAPLVHSAPLLSALLASISAIFHTTPQVSVVWLNAFCLALTMALVGFTAAHFLKSNWISWLAALMTVSALPMVSMHLRALSEPPYLLFSLLALVLIAYHWETPNIWLVVAAACAACLGIYTRYAGAALLGAGFLGVLFTPARRTIERLRETAAFALLSSLPFIAWLGRNYAVSGSATTATISTRHIITLATIGDGINTLSSWLLPGSIPIALRAAVAFAMAAIVIAGYRMSRSSRTQRNSAQALPVVMALFILCHFALNVAAISFAYSDIPLDDRNLLPVLAPAVLILVWLWKQMEGSAGFGRVAWVSATAMVFLMLATNVFRSVNEVRGAAASGRGYSSAQWRNAEVIRQLRALPRGVTVYTTLPSVFRYLTEHPARSLPEIYFDRTRLPNLNYQRDYNRMRDEARERGIAVVYGAQAPLRRFPEEQEVKQNLDLVFVTKDNFGSLHASRSLLQNGSQNRAQNASQNTVAEQSPSQTSPAH